jgi:hypothetical protein
LSAPRSTAFACRGQPDAAGGVQIAEGALVADLGDVVIVDVDTLEEGLGEQPAGGVTGLLEQLLRLVEQAQRRHQRTRSLGQIMFDRL